MSWALEPTEINQGDLVIRTYAREDKTAIARALLDPDGWFGRNWGLNTVAKIEEMVEKNSANRGAVNPMVYLWKGSVAGITNYMRLEARNKTLEIGGTWVAPAFRRTEVNTRVKCALLKHAFEVLGAIRVEFRVDERNYASQMGVLRLGAVREARLRHRQVYSDGLVTDGFLYSIIQPEWPQIYERLQTLIARGPVREKLAYRIPAERIAIEPYRLSDAAEFAALIAANREDLLESFPISAVQVVNEVTAQAYIADTAHKGREGTAFFYGVRFEGRLIGQFQLKSVDWKAKSAEFAYFVDRGFRRQGFAREMIEAGLREVFGNHGFNRVFVRVLPENVASAKLAERLEFYDEGVMRSAFVSGRGQLKDIHVFSKLNPKL